ncbi:MAG: mechanosensitive ion channel [Candidatus Thermoplasmatota archaeon]|nr:mechanosensitive ion channel [Candidatus Thermoplasmatota archaeon]
MMNLSNLAVDWNSSYGNGPPLWRIALTIGIMIIGFALNLFLSRFLPIYLSEIILSLDQRSRKKKGSKENVEFKGNLGIQISTFQQNIKNFIRWTVFLSFTIIAFNALGYDKHSSLELFGYDFSIWMIMKFMVLLIIALLFVRILLMQIIRLILSVLFGKGVTRKVFQKESKRLRGFTIPLFTIIAVIFAINFAFPDKQNLPFYSTLYTIFTTITIILGVLFSTRITIFILRVRYSIKKKLDSNATNAFENFVNILSVIIGLGILLSFYGIDPVAIFGALTFIGVAVAFGLQDSIANIMAGFMLAADKPFAIGDRVRVGDAARETWGDISKIGLNTTRIRTTEGELVVVPNSYIAKNEIWNYTRDSPVIVHKIDVGISYGSDWRLAKKIMIEEARAHPRVLKNPNPYATMDRFGDFSIHMKLWLWLKHALDREQVRSDLLESIKDRFDSEGVEIPYPYRTVVYKKELSKETRLADKRAYVDTRRYPSQGTNYFESGDWHNNGDKIQGTENPPGIYILVPSVNPNTAKKLATFAVDFAKKTHGEVTALYVMVESSDDKKKNGRGILDVFQKIGRNEKIPVNTILETGHPVDRIIEHVERENVDFIIIGKPEKGGLLSWMKEDIEKEIRSRSDVPLIILPD